jgi:hypothetical protein
MYVLRNGIRVHAKNFQKSKHEIGSLIIFEGVELDRQFATALPGLFEEVYPQIG